MATRSLVLVALAWALIGLVVAFVMRRKGHDFFVWLTLGVVLGPLSVPLAVERARFHGASERHTQASPTPQHEGFDLLAGIDGSQESLDALDAAISLFGPSLSSLTLSTVLDYDSRKSPSGLEAQAEVQEVLDAVSAGIGDGRVETELLFGRPDQALADYARTAGMELIVVGARGHGSTERVFGSITGRLVGRSEIPVFVGPRSAEVVDPLRKAVERKGEVVKQQSGAGTNDANWDPALGRAREEAQGFELYEDSDHYRSRLVEREGAQGVEVFTDPDSAAPVTALVEGSPGHETLTGNQAGLGPDEEEREMSDRSEEG